MNIPLLNEIVRHIFAQFAVVPSNFVDLTRTHSLMQQSFRLNEEVLFEQEDRLFRGKVWGCQLTAVGREIKVLLADCCQEHNFSEFAMLIQHKDSPAYGLYLTNHKSMLPVMLACSLDLKSWLECGTFLQATFLAAMEQIRDMGLSWEKCSDHKTQFQALLSFIDFYGQIISNN